MGQLVALLLQAVAVQIAYSTGYAPGAWAEYSSVPLNSRFRYLRLKVVAISHFLIHLIVLVWIRSTLGGRNMSILPKKRGARRRINGRVLTHPIEQKMPPCLAV
jgi:hypothetical protein